MEAEITLYKQGNSYKAYLNECACEMIKTDRIFFDKKNLKFRLSNFDDNDTLKLTKPNVKSEYKNKKYTYDYKGALFGFGGKNFNDDNLGKYLLEEENEWFILIR